MKNMISLCSRDIIKKFAFPYILNLSKDEVVNVILTLIDILPLLSVPLNLKQDF